MSDDKIIVYVYDDEEYGPMSFDNIDLLLEVLHATLDDTLAPDVVHFDIAVKAMTRAEYEQIVELEI